MIVVTHRGQKYLPEFLYPTSKAIYYTQGDLMRFEWEFKQISQEEGGLTDA